MTTAFFIDALSCQTELLPGISYMQQRQPNTSLTVLHSYALPFAPPKEITEGLLLLQVPRLVRTYFRLASHFYKSRDR